MLNIESVCVNISNYISKELKLDDDKRAVINYGIFAFIQMMICILMVIVCGAIFNVIIEALIVSFTTSILRKSSGGAHASSPERCAVIGMISSVTMALVAKHIKINYNYTMFFGGFLFIWAYYILYKLAPIDSIAKPIKSIDKKKMLKKKSIITLTLYLIIIIINSLVYMIKHNNNILVYSLCVYMGILWQVFSLTKTGHLILEKLN